MSADILRSAAKALRERAVPAVKGWGWRITDDRKWAVVVSSEGDVMAQTSDDDRAAYIATMHPGVALALADWLDQEVAALDFLGGLEDETFDPALRVAEAILGGAR